MIKLTTKNVLLNRVCISLVAIMFALSLIINVNYCEAKASTTTYDDSLKYSITAGVSLHMMQILVQVKEQIEANNLIETNSTDNKNEIPVDNMINQLVVESRNETKYVSCEKLNIRDYPSVDIGTVEGYLTLNNQIYVTGVTTDDNGTMWARITYDDGDSWICYNYLSDSEVEINTWSEEETYNHSWSGEVLNRRNGIVRGPIGKESYYNLNMKRVVQIMRDKGYDYEYWIRSDGVKMFGKYVMVAADLSKCPKGSLVETTLGTGIVCDTGDFVYSTDRALDIAVSW